MKRIVLELGLFRGPGDLVRSERVLRGLLLALASADASYLREHPECPMLYESGVVYEPEEPGHEDWQTVPYVLARGEADCEDLACFRVAELRVRFGIRATPRLTWRPQPHGRLYHITVQWPDGSWEDPSKILGMGKPRGRYGEVHPWALS